MKKIGLLFSMLLMLLSAQKNYGQTLACNDLVFVSLDENCSFTLEPEHILEGTILPNCVVELDKTAPFGNGPWVGPNLSATDIGNTYMVRVRHVPSGNICWGNLTVEDKLPPVLDCEGFSTVQLTGVAPLTLATTDLSITDVDACGAHTLLPASLQFDCADAGVQVLQLTATDAHGNSSTCQHTILVSQAATCAPCVASCPASVTVSYDEGNTVLLPAFQNNNLSAFDPYGNALFDGACSYVDSTYTVDYQVGGAGESWFERQWWWTDGGGQTSTCVQAILFPSTHTVTVHGQIYIDTDDDCVYDAGEQGVKQYFMTLTKLPSGVSQFVYPNLDGTYSADIEFGVQDLSADLQLVLPPNVNPVCPTAINIPNSTATPNIVFDMGLQSSGDCPVMQVDIGNLFTRRCATNSFKVNYCNVGLDTAYGAFVTLNLDPLITLESADLPYTVSGPDDLYTFQIGNVPPFYCGTIVIFATVSCDATLGQTVCNEANIYPDVPCSGAWQGPVIEASAVCSGDSVALEIRNTGLQDMGTPLNYIVVEDFIMYKDGTFQLDAGDAVIIKAPANGATWRLEAQQAPGFPVQGLVSTAIEGCGGTNTPGLITAFGQSDNAMNYDIECSVVVASCDPNDKTAVPTGVGGQNVIRANEPIDYKIRFQNTGTDTAFQVVVVDTLSSLLDANSLELGASSHPYRLNIYPGGILHFVFDPIVLPDSNVNEAASHGYLKFKIAQKPNLPEGTLIENQVAIYFDQNEPVFTNTAFHTIGYPFTVIDPLGYSAQTLPASCNGQANGAIFVQPTGGMAPYTFAWANPNLQGGSLTGLAAGIYQLTLTDSRGDSVVESFEISEPEAVSLALTATPTLGNDNSGAITATATGGTGAFSYFWSNGATTQNISGLAAGNYTLSVVDANGCTQSSVATVAQTVLPLINTVVLVHPNCHGVSNGSIALNVSGGLMPYNFAWSDPILEGSFLNGLPAGNYQVTLTDSYGGELVQSIELIAPALIEIQMDFTPAIGNANNGTATATATGGTGALSYLWSTGSTTPTIGNLPSGTYTVIVTDGNGCNQTSEVNVTQTILPLVLSSQISNPSCHGASNGAIFVTVTGGLAPFTFQWDNPNLQGNPLEGLPAGSYHLTLTDHNGTQLEESFELTEPAAITVALSSTPATNGQSNGTATATATGGTGALEYLWNTGASTAELNGLAAGIYTVVVTDANGCTASNSVEVQQFVDANEPGSLSRIQVWPNPAEDWLVVNLQEVLPQLQRLDLLAADGRLLKQFQTADLQELLTLKLGDQSAGMVMLVLYGQDGSVFTQKVVLR